MKGHAEYKILRDHNGTIEEITATYDPATGTLSFTTDAYSIYALAFNDPENPNTYDPMGSYLALGAVSMIGLVGSGVASGKTRKKTK